jgi:magnesium transporter
MECAWMNVRVFGISDRATLQPLPEQEFSASWQDDETHRWIDIEAATQQELRELLAPLQLHETILGACLDAARSERFISHRSALYLEVPTHLGWDQEEKPYISVLCLPSTIITIHRDRLHSIEDIARGLDAEVPLYAQSASALLYYLLLQVGEGNVAAALDTRGDAERLDRDYHENPDKLDPQAIAALRRRVSHYAAVLDDHAYIAGVLQTVESGAFRVSQQGSFFHEMLRLSELSRQLVDGAGSRVADLERDHEMSVQRRVDSRLRFLTILSAVFLPLTLISAVYGMNFNDLPGMGVPYGYLVVVALMFATAGFTAGYLYWRGWFE